MRDLAIFLVVLGCLWQLPTNWLLFLPVAIFWAAVAFVIAWLIVVLVDTHKGDW